MATRLYFRLISPSQDFRKTSILMYDADYWEDIGYHQERDIWAELPEALRVKLTGTENYPDMYDFDGDRNACVSFMETLGIKRMQGLDDKFVEKCGKKKHEAYAAWVEAFKAVYGNGEGLCWYAAEDMQRAFPELTRCYGDVTYQDGDQIEHEHHVWCVAPHGHVFDPTEGQFDQLFERRVLRTNPEFWRTWCNKCRANTFDLEPFGEGHKFEALNSEKVGDYIWSTGSNPKEIPHPCGKD